MTKMKDQTLPACSDDCFRQTNLDLDDNQKEIKDPRSLSKNAFTAEPLGMPPVPVQSPFQQTSHIN